MSLCGQSPLFVPTTVNAQIRNIDAVTVDADDIFCKTLTINGEVVSSVLQNIESSSAGVTVFDGEIQVDSLTSSGLLTTDTLTANDVTIANGVDTGSVTASGSVSGLIGTFDSITAITTSGNIAQSAGTTSLQGTTVTSLTDTGNLTMSGTSAALSQTGTSATASLKATTVTSLTTSGNITQSAGTTTLKRTVINADNTDNLLTAYYPSLASGTVVNVELGADSSNGVNLQFSKGSSTTANTASLFLNDFTSAGILNIAYDNINAPTFKTDKLTVNTSVTLPTSLTTPTAGQLGYVLSKNGNNAITLSTTLQEAITTTNYLTVGVWLITFQVRLSLAASTVANQVLIVLTGGTEAGNSGQLSQHYHQISATSTAISQTISGSRIITVTTAHTAPLLLYAQIATSVTTITMATSTDLRFSALYAVRIA